MKKIFIIILLIISFVVLICISFYLNDKFSINNINFDDKNNIGNTNGNIVNNAFVAKQNDWIYCQGLFNLYAFNQKSGQKVHLSSKSGNNLNVVGNFIFFTRSSGWGGFDSSDLYRFDLKNGKLLKIKKIITNNLIAYNNWIYYTDCTSEPINCLYKAKYDGTEIIKLTDFSVSEFNIIDNIIYTSTNDIKLLTLEGDIIRNIDFENELKSLAKRNIIFNNNEMYFIAGYQKNYGIAKLDIDSLEYIQIINEHCSNLNIKDEWIYFIKEKDQKLYKVKTDGGDEQQVGNVKVDRTGINIIDEWIYYTHENVLYRIKTDGSVCEKL